ncbi:hypothetical protein Bca101_068622 [Brassica carinata]
MIPYLLAEYAASDEERVKLSLEPYTYERPTVGVPQCRGGDCGVFTLKYIECHALGFQFLPDLLCHKNSKAIREKMAVEIFKELPNFHSTENEDIFHFVYIDDLPDDLPISRLISRLHIDAWINVLRKRYTDNPHHFRSDKLCFFDHLFAHHWSFNYKEFKDSEPDRNGLGRRLPAGAFDYYSGSVPSFCSSNRIWGVDITDVYAPVNHKDSHWIAMWIQIPKRHIVVFDSIISSISPETLDVVMEPFLHMIPYMLVECAPNDVYIECHALGMPFNKKDFAKSKGKAIRDKMAVDIFEEFPDVHLWENRDGDENYGAYGDDR